MSLLSRLCFTVSRALLLALCGLCGAGLSPPVAAQGRTVRRSVRPARRAVAARPRAPRVPLDRLPPPGPPWLDFQVGQGAINVQIADITADTTIRLGLAPGGVTVVEFPADDFIFATYPGDENFVTLDPAMVQRQRPTDPLVFRPGAGFAAPAAGPNLTPPYGHITVQMVSGVVFTFHIYPVRELRHSTTRVSLTYQVADVVAARARAGLPDNLH